MNLKLNFIWRDIAERSQEICEELVKGGILNGAERSIIRKFSEKYSRYAKLKEKCGKLISEYISDTFMKMS